MFLNPKARTRHIISSGSLYQTGLRGLETYGPVLEGAVVMDVLIDHREERPAESSDLQTTGGADAGGDRSKRFDPNLRHQSEPLPGLDYAGVVYPGRMERFEQTDEGLLDAYRHGDAGSFRKLVERYQRELFHFLVRFLGDRAAAEDVFQDTFLKVHEAAAGFDLQRRFRPWLFTIAANTARDLMRSRARRPANSSQNLGMNRDEDPTQWIDLVPSPGEMPGEALDKTELAERVRSTVMEMPDSLRQILLLSYFEQFPYKEIGDILGIPLGTVKSRLHAAVGDFAHRWKKLNRL
jgi:RNA polymerase sigma-70 factor (ECF subfamily)